MTASVDDLVTFPCLPERFYANVRSVDLSARSAVFEQFGCADLASMECSINAEFDRQGASLLHGGYLEHRRWYVRNESFTENDRERTIHLGVDLWVPADTPVLAAWSGVIYGAQDNAGVGDYGPTIIVQLDEPVANANFYLMGHLTRDSLRGRVTGGRVQAGEKIGAVGTPEVNGAWPSHLHFQLIERMEAKRGDFPGVCSKTDLSAYSANCPDPTPYLFGGLKK